MPQPKPTAGPGHRQKRCYACPGVAAQEIHRGGAGDAGGALSVGRALAACEDQSTHANAIKIALPTLAEADETADPTDRPNEFAILLSRHYRTKRG